jgi:hypothetical protein
MYSVVLNCISIVDLESYSNIDGLLPAHKLRTGDIVSLESYRSSDRNVAGKRDPSSTVQGVVFNMTERNITIVLEIDVPDECQERCKMFVNFTFFIYSPLKP